ncbi:MAG: RHS repeat-associated core domain-containing protein [Muribaculaceae bacterium]|nr:RHS repeat-associated core domain-containing protein [Muribaculaceae bacterium]
MSINNHTKTEQTVAYYPYGSVIADLGTGSDRQPFKFGGKELTLQNGLNEYDFGARQYYPAVPHFTTVDPLCEKTPWLSPYLYCGNNPVNAIDPTGMYILENSLREWNRNKGRIMQKLNSLESSVEKIKEKGKKKGWSQEKIANKIGDKSDRIASLDNTLSTMNTLENSDQGYSLSKASGNIGGVSLTDNNIIDISYVNGDVSNFVHEVTHAGQFETGDIAFSTGGGGTYLVDIHDEISAYQAQFAFEPKSLRNLNPSENIANYSQINDSWVKGIIVDSVNIYTPASPYNVGYGNVRIDSPIVFLGFAYRSNNNYMDYIRKINNVKQLPHIYYKK